MENNKVKSRKRKSEGERGDNERYEGVGQMERVEETGKTKYMGQEEMREKERGEKREKI